MPCHACESVFLIWRYFWPACSASADTRVSLQSRTVPVAMIRFRQQLLPLPPWPNSAMHMQRSSVSCTALKNCNLFAKPSHRPPRYDFPFRCLFYPNRADHRMYNHTRTHARRICFSKVNVLNWACHVRRQGGWHAQSALPSLP